MKRKILRSYKLFIRKHIPNPFQGFDVGFPDFFADFTNVYIYRT